VQGGRALGHTSQTAPTWRLHMVVVIERPWVMYGMGAAVNWPWSRLQAVGPQAVWPCGLLPALLRCAAGTGVSLLQCASFCRFVGFFFVGAGLWAIAMGQMASVFSRGPRIAGGFARVLDCAAVGGAHMWVVPFALCPPSRDSMPRRWCLQCYDLMLVVSCPPWQMYSTWFCLGGLLHACCCLHLPEFPILRLLLRCLNFHSTVSILPSAVSDTGCVAWHLRPAHGSFQRNGDLIAGNKLRQATVFYQLTEK